MGSILYPVKPISCLHVSQLNPEDFSTCTVMKRLLDYCSVPLMSVRGDQVGNPFVALYSDCAAITNLPSAALLDYVSGLK